MRQITEGKRRRKEKERKGKEKSAEVRAESIFKTPVKAERD
jgi:hypothetical protein